MARIFAEYGMSAKGNVLPLKDFKHFIDVEDVQFNPERGRYAIAKA